jgi:hypothetical protein
MIPVSGLCMSVPIIVIVPVIVIVAIVVIVGISTVIIGPLALIGSLPVTRPLCLRPLGDLSVSGSVFVA